MRRLLLGGALGLVVLALAGCDESGTGSVSEAPLATAPSSNFGSRSNFVSPSIQEFRDAVGPASASSGGSDPGRPFFDGAKWGSGWIKGENLVAAGSRSKAFRSTGLYASAKPRGLKINAPPAPKSGTLPNIDLPKPEAWTLSKVKGSVLAAFNAFQDKFYVKAFPTLSRVDWHAKRRKGVNEKQAPCRVTLHHTEKEGTTDEESTLRRVKEIQRYHMYGRAKEGKDNFDDIGYHFLIDGEGRIVEGRAPSVLGAHAHNGNMGNIGIALIGNYNKVKPTSEQIDSLRRLIAFLAIKYRTDPKQKGFLEPHKHFEDTDCPGKNLLAILGQLRKDVGQETQSLVQKLKAQDAAKITGRDEIEPVLAVN